MGLLAPVECQTPHVLWPPAELTSRRFPYQGPERLPLHRPQGNTPYEDGRLHRFSEQIPLAIPHHSSYDVRVALKGMPACPLGAAPPSRCPACTRWAAVARGVRPLGEEVCSCIELPPLLRSARLVRPWQTGTPSPSNMTRGHAPHAPGVLSCRSVPSSRRHGPSVHRTYTCTVAEGGAV
jgi:hypothetical protein